MHVPFGRGARQRDLDQTAARIAGLKREIALLEDTLTSLSSGEGLSDSQRMVQGVRLRGTEEELAGKRAELALLADRAGVLEADIEDRPSGEFSIPVQTTPDPIPEALAPSDEDTIDVGELPLRTSEDVAGVPSPPSFPRAARTPFASRALSKPEPPEPAESPDMAPSSEPASGSMGPPEVATPEELPTEERHDPIIAQELLPEIERPRDRPATDSIGGGAAAGVPIPAAQPLDYSVRRAVPSRGRDAILVSVGVIVGVALTITAGSLRGILPLVDSAPRSTAPAVAILSTAPPSPPSASATAVAVATIPVATPVPTSFPTTIPVVLEPTVVPDTRVEPTTEPTVVPTPRTAVAQPALPVRTIDAPGFQAVNLRVAPATEATIIRSVPVGTQVELLGDQTLSDGLAWQQVRVPSGEIGWVVAGTIDRP